MQVEQVERQALNDQQIAIALQLHGVETAIRSVADAVADFDADLVRETPAVDLSDRKVVLLDAMRVRRAG